MTEKLGPGQSRGRITYNGAVPSTAMRDTAVATR